MTSLRARARALRERGTLERDLASFRRRYSSVLRPKPPPGRGTALLASLSYSTFQVKLEGMIAKALQMQGFDVVAAVPRDGALVRRYFGVFGVERFGTLEDYASANGDVDAAVLLGDIRSAEDIKRLLKERPKAKGLTVPGMPAGSPGMEVPSGRVNRYDVLLVTPDGNTSVFATHGNK